MDPVTKERLPSEERGSLWWWEASGNGPESAGGEVSRGQRKGRVCGTVLVCINRAIGLGLSGVFVHIYVCIHIYILVNLICYTCLLWLAFKIGF